MMNSSTVCLSDLCDLIAEPADPAAQPDALYLGLEHVASGRLLRSGGGQASQVRSSKSSFQSGDVLYGKLRPYLDKGVLVEESGICTTELLVLRAKSKVPPFFLACVIHSPDFVEYAVTGTTGVQHPRTSWTHISGYELPAFTLEEQKLIARFLWLVHRLILEQDELIESAQSLKRVAMRTLFTEGMRGEAQKETEIGLVPESWSVVSFDSVRNHLQYGTSVRCTYELSEYPVLRIPNIESVRINSGNLKYCKSLDAEADKFRIGTGDLLFIRTNGSLERLGSCAVYSGKPANALFASYLIRARLKSDRVNPSFAAYFFSSELGINIITGRATPASDGKYNLNTGAIDSLLLPLPPTLDEQTEIVDILDTIDKKINLQRKKLAVLSDLLKALMHKLMTREIRITDLDLSTLHSIHNLLLNKGDEQ